MDTTLLKSFAVTLMCCMYLEYVKRYWNGNITGPLFDLHDRTGYLKQKISKWMVNNIRTFYESDEKYLLTITSHGNFYSALGIVSDEQVIQRLNPWQKGLNINAFREQGTSSSIGNVWCSLKNTELNHLCSKPLFYYMCTKDDDLSRNPHVFIKQFAIEIMKYFPKVGQGMYFNTKVSGYLYNNVCLMNPDDCLNDMVVEPLKIYKSIASQINHLLVVDYVNDCYQKGDNSKWNILHIIDTMVKHLPDQFKIILISRHRRDMFDIFGIRNVYVKGIALFAEGNYFRISELELSYGEHHDVIGFCKDETEIIMLAVFLYFVRSIRFELRTDQCLFFILLCCCFIKVVTLCSVILFAPTLLVISFFRMLPSSGKVKLVHKNVVVASEKEEYNYKYWFYQLNMTCDNIDIHCIIDERLEQTYKYLQAFYIKNERLEHILDSYITRSQSKENILSEFEKIYSNKSKKHRGDRLLMKHELMEASTNRYPILIRWVIAHMQENGMTVDDMKVMLDIAIEKHDKNIAKALSWCLTREFYVKFANILINAIDIYPGIRCLCRGPNVLDSSFCTHKRVIIILTRVAIIEKLETYHGFDIEEVNPDLANSDDSEAITISNLLSSKYTNSYYLNVNLSQNTVENIFNRHSNVTLICPSVLKSISFNKVHAVQERICIHLYCKKKGIIPLGEDHFPTLINGIPTDIIEGNICMITKLRIGDKIGPQTSIGTLGGFVQYLDFDCFLTCAHVMYDLQTLLSSSHDFSRLPGAKAFCHSAQGLVDCGKVIWRTFDHDDKLKTSIDAALVLMQNNATFDPNDFILDDFGNACTYVKLGLSNPFLNNNCLDHEEFCIPQQTAKVVGAGSMTKLEANVTFPKQTEVDILFSNAGQAASFYNGNVFQPLWINSPAHLQLGTGFLTDRRIFRMYNQITINLGLQPGDSGTCIYVVQHPYNKNGCIGMAIAFCGGMTVVTPLKDILKRISSS